MACRIADVDVAVRVVSDDLRQAVIRLQSILRDLLEPILDLAVVGVPTRARERDLRERAASDDEALVAAPPAGSILDDAAGVRPRVRDGVAGRAEVVHEDGECGRHPARLHLLDEKRLVGGDGAQVRCRSELGSRPLMSPS